jgi:hypothetical protein
MISFATAIFADPDRQESRTTLGWLYTVVANMYSESNQVNSARTPSLSIGQVRPRTGQATDLGTPYQTAPSSQVSQPPGRPLLLFPPMMKLNIEAMPLDLIHGDNAQREQLILFAYVPYIRLSSPS